MVQKIQYTDNLKEGTDKLNQSIDQSNAAILQSNNADQKSTQALNNSVSTQTQLDNIVVEGDSSVEAAQARVDSSGTSHPTLKSRIDNFEVSATQQLQHISSIKASKTEVYDLLGNVSDGTPLFAETISEMNNVNRVYVNLTDGFLYKHNGTSWINLEIKYQSDGIAYGSVSSKHIVGTQTAGKNLFDKYDVEFDKYISSATGEVISGTSNGGLNAISGYIDVPDDGFYAHSTYANVICHDENKNFIEGFAGGSPRTLKLAEGTKKVRLSFKKEEIDFLQFERGNIITEYEEHKYTVYNLVVGDMGKNDNETLEKRIKTHGIMYLGSNAELYTEKSAGIIYLGLNNQKLAVIFVDNEKVRNTASWDIEAIKAKYPEKVVTSPKGVENCIKMNSGSVLYFDIMAQELIIEYQTYNNLLDKYIVLGVVNQYGNLIGGDLVHNNINPNRSIRNENKIEELYTNLSNAGDRLPVHFMEEVKDTVEKIENIATKPSLMLNILTDSHSDTFGDDFKYIRETSDNIREVNQHNPSDGILHLGDFVAGAKTKRQAKETIRTVLKNLRKSNIPIFPLRGNHDDNSYGTDKSIENLLLGDMFYSLSQRQADRNTELVREGNNNYYYVNYPKHKIRVIMLDSIDYPITEDGTGGLVYTGLYAWGYGKTQVEWLANTALQVDQGWSVIVFSHMPSRASHSLVGRNVPTNSEHIESILKSFKNGTSYTTSNLGEYYGVTGTFDFTSQGARDLIAYVFGHTHMDMVDTPVDLGYPCISICNNTPSKIDTTVVPTGGIAYDRTVGTLSQDLWETLIVRQDERKIYLIRFGAGDDRVINY